MCPMLGIELDVSDLSLGIRVVNRPGRVEEVKAAVHGFFERGEIGTRDMLRMMGRVQFADAQVMGRAGKLALADARSWSRNHLKCIPLSPGLRDAFEILLQRLTSGAPRLIPCGPAQPLSLCLRALSHTIGGLLVRPGARPSFFAASVPHDLVQEWETSMKHLIGPVECYAAVVARHVWHQFLARKPCLRFIDNVACQDAFVRGTSTSPAVRKLLLAHEKCEQRDVTWTWFARVASESNPSDDPSRGCFHEVLADLEATRDSCLCPLSGTHLKDLTSPVGKS